MRRLLLLAAVLLAPSAQAKEPGPMQLCGIGGCVALAPLGEFPVRTGVPDPSVATEVAVAPAPYYFVNGAVWVPSAFALRIAVNGSPTWVATLPAEDSLLRAKAAGLRPYVPPARPRVYVDFDPVKRSFGWQRLFTIGVPASAPATTRWLPILLAGGRSPWDDGVWLWISKSGGFLKRDGRVYAIPVAAAKRIRGGNL